MATDIVLRDVIEEDLAIFYEHQLDPEAIRMAAFTVKDPTDRDAFLVQWAAIVADSTKQKKTILCNGEVAGHVGSFEQFGLPSVSYWLGKAYWGKGVASKALSLFLNEAKTRPLYARAAKDNRGSIRVLQKCGFVITGEDRGFANGRNEEIEEFILTLQADCSLQESIKEGKS